MISVILWLTTKEFLRLRESEWVEAEELLNELGWMQVVIKGSAREIGRVYCVLVSDRAAILVVGILSGLLPVRPDLGMMWELYCPLIVAMYSALIIGRLNWASLVKTIKYRRSWAMCFIFLPFHLAGQALRPFALVFRFSANVIVGAFFSSAISEMGVDLFLGGSRMGQKFAWVVFSGRFIFYEVMTLLIQSSVLVILVRAFFDGTLSKWIIKSKKN